MVNKLCSHELYIFYFLPVLTGGDCIFPHFYFQITGGNRGFPGFKDFTRTKAQRSSPILYLLVYLTH